MMNCRVNLPVAFWLIGLGLYNILDHRLTDGWILIALGWILLDVNHIHIHSKKLK